MIFFDSSDKNMISQFCQIVRNSLYDRHSKFDDPCKRINSLCLIFFGEQQLTNGTDKEGDLMRFITYKNILYKV